MKHGIVIPCYNEASRLQMDEFIEFANHNKDIVLCFVNDGSKDPTRSALASLKEVVHDNISIYNLSENAGKADAVRSGALFLYEETEVETIGFLDADLSTSFEEYRDLLKTHGDSKGRIKIVFGSRNMKGEGEIKRNPLRKIFSDIIKMLIFLISRMKIADTQCGAKVFDRSLIPLIYRKLFFSRWLFDIEILLRLRHQIGKRKLLNMFCEQPLANWVHMDGSKLSAKDAVMIPWNLLKIWIEYEGKILLNQLATNKKALLTSQN